MEESQLQPLDWIPGVDVASTTSPTTHIAPTDSTTQLGGGGNGGSGELALGHPAASIEYGELIGSPPDNFDGQRSNSETFLLRFNLYRMINRNHQKMVIPFDRALLALSYMQGPKVDYWKNETFKELVHLVTAGAKLTDEALWAHLEQKFRTAFADTNKKVNAEISLVRHRMKGNDLETYLWTFEHLRRDAEWGRDEQGTILQFRQGLEHPLHKAIIERVRPRPITMDDWQSAARTEHAVNIELKNMSMYNSQQALGGKRKQGRQPSKGTGVIETTPRLDEKRKRLIAEGRCFFCKAKGHMSRQCPKKM